MRTKHIHQRVSIRQANVEGKQHKLTRGYFEYTLKPIKPTLFKGERRKLLRGTRFPIPLSDINNNIGPLARLPLLELGRITSENMQYSKNHTRVENEIMQNITADVRHIETMRTFFIKKEDIKRE